MMTPQSLEQIDIREASQSLPDLVEAVLSGKEVVITRDSQPIAKLVSVTQSKPRPQFGSARGLITLSDDFDEPLLVAQAMVENLPLVSADSAFDGYAVQRLW